MQITSNNINLDQKVYQYQNYETSKESIIPLIFGEAAKAIFKPLKAAVAISKPFTAKAIITPILHKAAKTISKPLKAAIAKSNPFAAKSNSHTEDLKTVNLNVNEMEDITKVEGREQKNCTQVENNVDKPKKIHHFKFAHLKNFFPILSLKGKMKEIKNTTENEGADQLNDSKIENHVNKSKKTLLFNLSTLKNFFPVLETVQFFV